MLYEKVHDFGVSLFIVKHLTKIVAYPQYASIRLGVCFGVLIKTVNICLKYIILSIFDTFQICFKEMGRKKTKELIVSYTVSNDEVKHRDGSIGIYPKFGSATYTTSAVKRYHNCLMAICGVSGVARDLMDWLTLQMNHNNLVTNSRSDREDFMKFVELSLEKSGEKGIIPTHNTIKDAFLKLADRNLLIPVDRGKYMVNPEYFMNPNNEKGRAVLIRMVLEFRSGVNTKITVFEDGKQITK